MCRSLTTFVVVLLAAALTFGLLASVGDGDATPTVDRASASWIATAFPVARPGPSTHR